MFKETTVWGFSGVIVTLEVVRSEIYCTLIEIRNEFFDLIG